jgi:hypothetical protein
MLKPIPGISRSVAVDPAIDMASLTALRSKQQNRYWVP